MQKFRTLHCCAILKPARSNPVIRTGHRLLLPALDADVLAGSLTRCSRSYLPRKTDCFRPSPLSYGGQVASLATTELPVRIGALELAQQMVATLDGEVEGRLRGLLAAENLFEFILDHAAYQHKGSKPDSL